MRLNVKLLLVVFLGLSEAGKVRQKQIKRNSYGYERHENGTDEVQEYSQIGVVADETPNPNNHPGYQKSEGYGTFESADGGHRHEYIASGKYTASGSGLRSIAQGSTDQTHTSVFNQNAAKSTLALAASQAAGSLAALAGKEVLFNELQQQSSEARHALESEIAQLILAKRSAKSSKRAAQQAVQHVNVVQAALNSAQTVAEHVAQTAREASAELVSQTAMVGKAKQRLQAVEHQLKRVVIDFEATKEVTEKASSAAQESQYGLHANIALQESPNNAFTSQYHTQEEAHQQSANEGIEAHQNYHY